MAGVKGRSGTNKGKDRPFREALRMEIANSGEDLKELRFVAEALLAKAKGGDVQAIREVADRLDGRPAQIQAGDPDSPIEHVHRIEIVAPDIDSED